MLRRGSLVFALMTACGDDQAGTPDVAVDDAAPDGSVVQGAPPILFVTQVPTAGYNHVAAAFGAHGGSPTQAPRGGALMLRDPDGTLRDLTAEAGYGVTGAQDGANAIAVRQPVVHWSGTRAMFAMLVGAPTARYQVLDVRWQLYEVTGLAQGQTASITKVPCQPATYNNIAPVYGSDDQILFVSDRPRSGAAHLYPQRDEYESTPIDSGIWKLDPTTCTVRIVEHAPSGVTYPTIDSFGRVIFTKWDHLLRDQQADQDVFNNEGYDAFNYDSEEQIAPPATFSIAEVFPELRERRYSLLPGQGYDGVSADPSYPFDDLNFNHFFPWQMHQDGSEEETLEHVGRHELGGTYGFGSYRDDPALVDIVYGQYSGATEQLYGSGGMFHLREAPLHPGRFLGVRSPEFATATAGDLISIDGAPGQARDQMKIAVLADKDDHGLFRNPLPMTDGSLVVVHADASGMLVAGGTAEAPTYSYAFRLRQMIDQGQGLVPGPYLTDGIMATVTYWSPDVRLTWSGALWELDPVEVVARPAPPTTRAPALPAPEQAALAMAAVDQQLLTSWLHQEQLALVVSRDVTTRDRSDRQQPFNLRVTASGHQTLATNAPTATLYDVTHLQLFQADQVRGYGTNAVPQQGGGVQPGRRVLPRPMHDPRALAAMPGRISNAIPGATPLGIDGSMAAFVPAGRAMAWQLVDASKTGWRQAVVRERNWVSFRAGETRVCASCHGANELDQAGAPPPQNMPLALVDLMVAWRGVVRGGCAETGGTGAWSYAGTSWSPVEDGRRYRIQTCQGGNACCDGLPASEVELVP